ncbi:MAG: iron chelate uptake ABC transporter family permease subunit, partial [Chloroflexota bacterium]|nr:iron chelate uptake ABC transporter family permease subunit [Chloroflexota bacterium]
MTTSAARAADRSLVVGWLPALRRRPLLLVGVGLLALAAALVAGVSLGNVPVAATDILALLAHRLLGWPVSASWPASAETIIVELRLPRVFTAMATGVALALAGATFQG